MSNKPSSFELDIAKGRILTKIGKQTNAMFPVLIFSISFLIIFSLLKIFSTVDILTCSVLAFVAIMFIGCFLYFAINKPDYLQSEEYRYAVKHLELSRDSKYIELLNDDNDILENSTSDMPLLTYEELSEPDKEEDSIG